MNRKCAVLAMAAWFLTGSPGCRDEKPSVKQETKITTPKGSITIETEKTETGKESSTAKP